MTTRNKYTDGDQLSARGYDIIQPKYDGWWTRCVSLGGVQQYFSDSDRLFHNTEFRHLPDGVFLGEFMRGTQWSRTTERTGRFYLFDALEINGRDIADKPYGLRYTVLQKLTPRLPPTFEIVPCFRMEEHGEVWARYVVEKGYEGVVYRRSEDPYGATIIRNKQTFTVNGVVIGFDEGDGKHSGRVGAVIVKLETGAEGSVGNGFDDETREHMYQCGEYYLGKTMEIETNAVFHSGNIRHGRFVRWRGDRS